MSNDDSTPGMASWAGLRYSITSLVERFGRTDSPILGLTINGSIAMAGFALWRLTSGVVSAAAFVIAWLSVIAIGKWVVKQ